MTSASTSLKWWMRFGPFQLKCPTNPRTGLLPGFPEPTELKPCWPGALSEGDEEGPSQRLPFPFHRWLEGPSIKDQSKETSFPSLLHVWLSSQVGMACTWWALDTPDRDSELWQSRCSAELAASGLALSLLLASSTGKLIAAVILLFVPVYIPGIRYLNAIK